MNVEVLILNEVSVISKDGKILSPCSNNRARELVRKNHAEWLTKEDSIVLIMTREEKARVRQEVFKRDDYTCQYCGKKLDDETATADHVIPRSKGGSYFPHNIVCACKSCNVDKGDTMPKKYLSKS